MLLIEIPFLPPRELSPNVRVHYHQKAKVLREFKEWVYLLAVEAKGQSDWEAPLAAKISITFVLPDRRRRDIDNLLAAFKAGLDGIVQAGVIKDDSLQHLKFGEVKAEYLPGQSKTIVTIKEGVNGD